MQEYGLIVLNIFEYAKLLDVSDVVHNIKSLCKLMSSCQDRGGFRTLSNIDGAFWKGIMPECRHVGKMFQVRVSVA